VANLAPGKEGDEQMLGEGITGRRGLLLAAGSEQLGAGSEQLGAVKAGR